MYAHSGTEGVLCPGTRQTTICRSRYLAPTTHIQCLSVFYASLGVKARRRSLASSGRRHRSLSRHTRSAYPTDKLGTRLLRPGYGSLDRVPALYGYVCPPSVLLKIANDIIASENVRTATCRSAKWSVISFEETCLRLQVCKMQRPIEGIGSR